MRPFRQELKYLVHHGVAERLQQRWARYLVRAPFTDEYAVSPILSQYYDSPDLLFYQEKLAGVADRNKVRLRTYGYTRTPGVAGFIEIKQRVFDRIRKVRQPIHNFRAGHLDPANWEFDDRTFRDAFLRLLERHRLRPSAQVFYLREAYQGAVEEDVRITWDRNLMGLYPGEKINRASLDDHSRYLMPETLVVLELKATHGFPRWAHEGILAAELRQRTIPKYITAVEVLKMHEFADMGVYA